MLQSMGSQRVRHDLVTETGSQRVRHDLVTETTINSSVHSDCTINSLPRCRKPFSILYYCDILTSFHGIWCYLTCVPDNDQDPIRCKGNRQEREGNFARGHQRYEWKVFDLGSKEWRRSHRSGASGGEGRCDVCAAGNQSTAEERLACEANPESWVFSTAHSAPVFGEVVRFISFNILICEMGTLTASRL